MKAEKFDDDFDARKDISRALDLTQARRVKQTPKRVNVDFPVWMIQKLDKEAKRLATTRQSIIKIWLAERLDRPKVPHHFLSTALHLLGGAMRDLRLSPNVFAYSSYRKYARLHSKTPWKLKRSSGMSPRTAWYLSRISSWSDADSAKLTTRTSSMEKSSRASWKIV